MSTTPAPFDLSDVPATATQQGLAAFFLRYHQAGLEEKVTLAHALIASGRSRAAAAAAEVEAEDGVVFDVVQGLARPLQRLGRWADLEGLLDAVARHRPRAYLLDLGHYAQWRAEDALLGGGALRGAVQLLGRHAAGNLAGLLAVLDRLRFHGMLGEVLTALQVAWPALCTCAAQLPREGEDTLEDLRALAFYALIDQHLEHTPRGQASARAVRTLMAPFAAPGMALDQVLLDTLTDKYNVTATAFSPADFTPEQPALRGQLARLTAEFSFALYQRLGWPRPRADLARGKLLQLLHHQLRPRATPQPSALLPEVRALEEFLGKQLQPMHAHPHRLAALAIALPAWVDFLVDRRLADPGAAAILRGPLRQVAQLLAAEVEDLVCDPGMQAGLLRTAAGQSWEGAGAGQPW